MKRILAMLIAIAMTAGCRVSRVPYVFEIPEGYIGWVRIYYDRTDCEELPMKEGKLVLGIGHDGVLRTSSDLGIGTSSDEYYYVGKSRIWLPRTEWHGGGMIWCNSMETTSSGSNISVAKVFFVGTEKDYLSQNSSRK